MQTKAISSYFSFGAGFRYLKDVKVGYPVHGDSFVLENITWFLRYLDQLSLVVTKRTKSARELNEIAGRLGLTSPDFILDEESTTKIVRLMVDVEKTLIAELQGKMAYIVTEKRMDISKLLLNVNQLFPAGIFERLSEIAKNDFNEAGKCIAFERPTAAAFHLLRGTESVIKDYYCSLVKRGRVSMWGPMVKHLRTIRKRPDKTLLNNLDNIRESFRNPTQHPEKIYDIDEAQDLFGLCCDVVCRMLRVI